jgi:hypothetical protein
MVNQERCFTLDEAAKLLGVSTTAIKRRIKNKELVAKQRNGRRGVETVIPQRALNLEIMSFVPTAHLLTLSDFEAIILKRFEAIAGGRDQRIFKALKQLRKEYAQLTAELSSFQTISREPVPSPAIEAKAESSAKQNLRAKKPVPSYRAFGLSQKTAKPLAESRELPLKLSIDIKSRTEVGAVATALNRRYAKRAHSNTDERRADLHPLLVKQADVSSTLSLPSSEGAREGSRAIRRI